jgi:hypothetical protein
MKIGVIFAKIHLNKAIATPFNFLLEKKTFQPNSLSVLE